MKTLPAILAGVLAVQLAYADAASIIKQHAKDLANQNNAREGASSGGSQPSQSPSTPAAPAQSANLTQLQLDLSALKAGEPATKEQKDKLAQDLVAAAETGTKPSLEAARTLAGDLASAFAQKPLPAQNRAQFVRELDALLNPSKYPQAKADGILTQMQSIFLGNGLSRDDAKKIAEDVKALIGKK